MNQLQTSTLSTQNITTALLAATYTLGATYSRGIFISVCLDGIAGNGNYQAYVTRQLAGAGTAFATVIASEAVGSGVTNHVFNSIEIIGDATDVLKVYVVGLAGDTSVTTVLVRFYCDDYIRPSVADATLVAGNLDAAVSTRSTLAAGAAMTLTSAYDAAKTAAPTVGAIDTQLTSTHGSGAWGAGLGGSLSIVTAALVNSNTSSPVIGAPADLFATTGSPNYAKTGSVLMTVLTDVFGVATFNNLTAGTYWIGFRPTGYTPTSITQAAA